MNVWIRDSPNNEVCTMYRLLFLLPFLLTGCNDARSLSKAQLEAALSEKAQFSDVSLVATGENQYSGTANDGAGQDYLLTVNVLRTRIEWSANGIPKKVTKDRVEQTLVKQLSLDSLSLEEKEDDKFEGSGTTKEGEKIKLEVIVKGDAYSVNWKDKDGKPRGIQMTISEGSRTSRGGSFTP
jgi:hypothetical protein